MDYKRARELIDVLNAVLPEGEATLTRKNSNFILLNALLQGHRGLATLIAPNTILARLSRAELGDFDRFVIANLPISGYSGQIILPDFGFYAHPGHVRLLRQGRLIAGINSFAEIPALKTHLLLVDTKIPSHCTAADAEVLAQYEGLLPGTNAYNEYNEYIDSAIH